MIFQTPSLEPIDRQVLALVAGKRDALRAYSIGDSKRWFGSLRRSTLARAIQGSNSIEGYHASVDEAIAAIDNEFPQEGTSETWLAIKGYRDALTCIMQAAADPYFEFSKQFLKSLHFMMLGHEMSKKPGQWRSGGIFVVDTESGDTVYQAPDVEDVNDLVEELIQYLMQPTSEDSVVRGAMAHLNLTMIHPFKDGNGRMARAIQTLVIALDGMMNSAFCSIEEWLGANTQEYYRVLSEVGQGSWNPENSALPWVRFCLKAHYQQAATLLRRYEEYEVIFNRVTELVRREKLPDRAGLPLFDTCLGLKMTNIRYRSETEVTEFVASRDLRRMVEMGLLEPKGQNRGRSYVAGPELKTIRAATRTKRHAADPYDIARRTLARDEPKASPRLPGF